MSDERSSQRPSGPRKKRPFQRRKVCRFCAEKNLAIDYKEPRTLRYFISERGKIVPRRISGNCSAHQREITEAIKISHRVVMNFYTAKRLLNLLAQAVAQHEMAFGQLELDAQRRVRTMPRTAAPPSTLKPGPA